MGTENEDGHVSSPKKLKDDSSQSLIVLLLANLLTSSIWLKNCIIDVKQQTSNQLLMHRKLDKKRLKISEVVNLR
jgi:hypothetical protein